MIDEDDVTMFSTEFAFKTSTFFNNRSIKKHEGMNLTIFHLIINMTNLVSFV